MTEARTELALRDPDGRDVVVRFRHAVESDIAAIDALIARSIRSLGLGDYSAQQIEAALGSTFGVDSQLICDRTYFVGECGATFVAAGGWSWRKTLFGADGRAEREPEALDPKRDAARIRAFFVDPDWVRRGLGQATLALCEAEALAAGFTSMQLMATLPGERLYARCGYVALAPIDHPLPGGLALRLVPMHKQLRGHRHVLVSSEASPADNHQET